ncbi:sulfate adenylyltransferase subunit CysN [Tichowtungia aerotolerans]|uniref:Multifunctional fusion protein n=1 Tax=Tichowtungia aerotolerans TaxID=2697043 RepID=A0A6P1MEX9_9BACT|nr:sulfate adenylyltransferase subunit CysN [Tichowtungia aerotolerans]QHI70176.1 sulfate adenylyltransferase subunit CysN [Tichowtungia aerotolerans]
MSEANYQIQEKELIESDIAEYLNRHETKDLLRLLTCGSVDDGKSTLIGRLLYDSHMIYEDQLEKVAKDSKVYGTTGEDFDPALLTDGLKAEREQGITIDVAYRYFSTDKRKFIIADCPGHEQYTRNMATGASTCNLAVILIDARYGVIRQTKRHSFICSLLGIRHVIVAVNKMDLVDWSEQRYNEIVKDYNAFVGRLGFSDIHFIPMSALKGDNVVEHSDNLSWYDGPTFLHHLENVNIATDRNLIDMRLPVQYVLRPNLDFRGFSGTLASGVIRIGDKVASLPSRQESKIKAIYGPDGAIQEAFAPQAVTVTLEDEIDVSRGNMLVPVKNIPHIGNEFEAMVVWMHEDAAKSGKSYLIKHTSSMVPGVLSSVRYKVDVNTMKREQDDSTLQDSDSQEARSLELNEIGRCHLTLHRPIAFDSYERNRTTGAFIIVDRMTNVTVGAGMIIDRIVAKEKNAAPVSKNIVKSDSLVSAEDRQNLLNQKGSTLWLTGLSGSGKSTVARQLERELTDMGHACYILDGDNVRHGLNRDLGFSAEDRSENIRRIAEVSRLFNDAGIIVITAFISPTVQDRKGAREIIGEGFVEVFVDTPLEICEQRDPKGLYKKARAGEIPQFTGISAPYEPPVNPEIVLNAADAPVEDSVDAIVSKLRDDGIIG